MSNPMATIYPPYVIERSSRGERTYDIFSRLLMDRIVFLGTPINDDVANIIIAQLLFLEADNPERDIFVYVNSPGGSVSAGLAIYDTMQYLKAPVNTICMGLAASEKDVDDRVAKVAEQRGTEPGQVYASLQKAGRLPEIERSITEEKVFEWLTSRNDVTNAIDS